MVRVGGGSTKFYSVIDRWIVYTKSRNQLLHRKYLLYETGCISMSSSCLFLTLIFIIAGTSKQCPQH